MNEFQSINFLLYTLKITIFIIKKKKKINSILVFFSAQSTMKFIKKVSTIYIYILNIILKFFFCFCFIHISIIVKLKIKEERIHTHI